MSRFLRSARARAVLVAVVAAVTLPASPAYATTTATMQGTITDAVTGAPAADVCVLVWKIQGNTAYEQGSPVCTGADGHWSQGDLDAGTYVVEAGSRFYETQYAYGEQALWDGHRFTLIGGQVAIVDLAMEPAGEVAGTVTDAVTGEPIDACAQIDVVNNSLGACTDEDGRYRVEGVPPGTYTVWFTSTPDYSFEYAHDTTDYAAAERFTVAVGQTTTVDEDLSPSSAVSGTVTDAVSGAPLADVCLVAAEDPHLPNSVGWACTDAAGQYRMESLHAGTYHLLATDSSGAHPRTFHPGTTDPGASVPVTIEVGGETTGADFVLGPAAYVSGSVTDAATGAPLAGVCAYALTTGGAYVEGSGGPDHCTDAAGHYTVGGLPSGQVAVHFEPPGGTYLSQRSAAVTVTTGQTTAGVDAALVQAGRIAGTVTDLLGRPVEGVCATVGVYSDRSGEEDGWQPPVCSGADGRYEIAGLRPGTYTVQFYDPQGDWAWQFYPGKADRTDATPVTVAAASTRSGVDARVSPGGTIEGVVVDEATGAAVKFVCAEAFTASRHPIGTSGCTGADGRYRLRGLPTTTVKVSFTGGRSGYASEWAVDRPDFASATPLPTVAGGVTPLPVRVSRSPAP